MALASTRSRDDLPARLIELARIFLRLGTISFGGPAAHIALMRREFVDKRRWLSDRDFLDLIGATNLIPGPNSTEMALHIGHVRAGWRGLLVAGSCFILPAVVIVAVIAAAYVRVGMLPSVQSVFYGVKPVVVVIVAIALWQLARTAVRSRSHAVIAVAALAGVAAGVNELLLLALGAVAGIASRGIQRSRAATVGALFSVSMAGPIVAGAAVTSSQLFFVFLKAGALLFGSGYVLLAFLRADLVERLKWFTEQQLLDAISIGQFTPGPVFTTATFIGYVLDGGRGAVIATTAIFLPAFVYVALSGPLVPRLRRSETAAGVLDGVNIASLALMAAVTWELGRAAVMDVTTAILALGTLAALVALRVNPAWLIAIGGLVGFALTQL